jgi:hypothetical protein
VTSSYLEASDGSYLKNLVVGTNIQTLGLNVLSSLVTAACDSKSYVQTVSTGTNQFKSSNFTGSVAVTGALSCTANLTTSADAFVQGTFLFGALTQSSSPISTNYLRNTAITGTLSTTGEITTDSITVAQGITVLNVVADSVRANVGFKVGTRNLLGGSAKYNQSGTIAANGYMNLNVSAIEGGRYMAIFSVTINDTSNNSMWSFMGHQKYNVGPTLPYQTAYTACNFYSSSVYYTKDLIRVTWMDYFIVDNPSNVGSTVDMVIKCYNTATPSTAKSGSASVQLIFLGY